MITKLLSDWFKIEQELLKASTYPGLAFQVWCLMTLKKIKETLQVIREKSAPSEKFQKYLESGSNIQRLYCKKNEDGTPFVIQTSEGLTLRFEGENKHLFNISIDELNEEYKDEIKNRDDQMMEYNNYVDSTIHEFDLKKLNPIHLPEKFFEQNPDKSLSFLTTMMDLIDFKDDSL